MKKAVRLPKKIKEYFWDVDFKKLTLKKYPNFILERILNFGNIKAVRWMLNAFDKRKIKRYILSSGDRQLDRRSNNFWRICFDLPASRKPVNPLWPY